MALVVFNASVNVPQNYLSSDNQKPQSTSQSILELVFEKVFDLKLFNEFQDDASNSEENESDLEEELDFFHENRPFCEISSQIVSENQSYQVVKTSFSADFVAEIIPPPPRA